MHVQDEGGRLTAADTIKGLHIAFDGAPPPATGDVRKLSAYNPDLRMGAGNISESLVLDLVNMSQGVSFPSPGRAGHRSAPVTK